MKLRSTTNTVVFGGITLLIRIKPSNNPSKPIPLSSDEFNRVTSKMRKTQNAILAQCQALFVSFKKMCSELQSSVDSLASQIVDLRADNTSLRKDLSALNDRLHVVESDVSKSTTSSGDNIPQLFQELSERKMLT